MLKKIVAVAAIGFVGLICFAVALAQIARESHPSSPMVATRTPEALETILPSPTIVPTEIPAPAPTVQPTPTTAPEAILAYADGAQPTAATLKRYRNLLARLSKGTGDDPAEIARLTMGAQAVLRDKYNREVTLLELLEGAELAIPRNGIRVSYNDIIVMMVMLMTSK